jgi:3-dehydroquinate synthase
MRTFRVELGAQAHPVHIGPGLIARAGDLIVAAGLDSTRCAVVTDATVAPLYASPLVESLATAGFEPALIEVAPGEQSKSLHTAETVFEQIAQARIERSGFVVALGGGVVGDLAGFVAATYLRGIALIQVPTTLTAQVDSSLGGKTAVNLRSAKNLVGAFHQPRAVIADIATLSTLGEREFREGLAEVIKYAAIMDGPMIADLERDMDAILRRDLSVLEAVVERSLRHKAYVVERDEHESGLRRILNFGHTIGHALETAAGYGSFLHGEAVAVGMVAAARLSREFAALDISDEARLVSLIERAGLPTAIPTRWRELGLLDAMALDKKRAGGAIEFILLRELGHAITRRLTLDEIVAHLS